MSAPVLSEEGELSQQKLTAAHHLLVEANRDVQAQVPGSSAIGTITISSDTIAPGKSVSFIRLQPQGAVPDQLNTISQANHAEPRMLVLGLDPGQAAVTLKHASGGAGELLLANGADFVLTDSDEWLVVARIGNAWVEMWRSHGSDAAGWRDFFGVPKVPARHKTQLVGGDSNNFGPSSGQIAWQDGGAAVLQVQVATAGTYLVFMGGSMLADATSTNNDITLEIFNGPLGTVADPVALRQLHTFGGANNLPNDVNENFSIAGFPITVASDGDWVTVGADLPGGVVALFRTDAWLRVEEEV